MDPVRRRANERLKVLPARSLSNLYQSADSILDNLFKTGGYGWRGGEWREVGQEVGGRMERQL